MLPVKYSGPELFVSFEGFVGRNELIELAEERAAYWRGRGPRIDAITVHTQWQCQPSGDSRFAVCVTAESEAVAFMAHHSGPTAECAVAAAFGQLERTFRQTIR